MINNYKAQRNVRAELGGAVDLGEPVSLYIKEDEIKFSSKNLATNGKFQDGTVTPFTTDTGSVQMDAVEVATNPVSGRTSLRLLVGDANDVAQGDFNVSVGKTYKFSFNRTIPNHTTNSKCKFRLGFQDDVDAYANIISFTSNTTTGVFRESFMFTAINSTLEFRIIESGSSNDAEIFIDDIQLHEVVDHSYKLMAINDTIPAQGVNTEAVGSELASEGDFENAGAAWSTSSSTITATVNTGAFVSTGDSDGGFSTCSQSETLIQGRTYKLQFDVTAVTGSPSVHNFCGALTKSLGAASVTTFTDTFVASSSDASEGGIDVRTICDNGESVTIDNISFKEVFGYDYYNAPAYKFGIVSSVYDQSTGAMKTSGVAGDEVDVTVQGECTLHKSGTYSLNKNRLIGKITNSAALTTFAAASVDGDYALPNTMAVTSEQTSSSNTQPIILWQGVEFSEHFVHKNSLQVMAKCDETITKFRPVSIFLDSEGDLLCRHDDIPEKAPDADTDHTGVDPGKWGVAELGGVSGDIIPVTVAGKTHINTSFNLVEGAVIRQIREDGGVIESSNYSQYAPNALGTTLKTGNGDIPITIFQGTPIGTITDWKRTIKVTAKANGAITQYCPVSLYLDANGNYKCISDDIPNTATDTSNGIWCDFRKWGVAQETVADGENVEIIVQGRTNVVNSLSGANREEFVLKISSSGGVTSGAHGSTAGFALSSLGIVEKEARTSNGTPGTIIIF